MSAPGGAGRVTAGEWPARVRIACVRIACVGAAVLATGCAAGQWQGTPSDPAVVSFSDELGVDLARMEQVVPGLYLEDLTDGIGVLVDRTSHVWIHYAVWLPDGTLVDTSVGREPFEFTLGGNEVIRGWNHGIPGMRVGGRRRLVVRPGLAYGSRGQDKVPPDATLVFEVQLVSAR